MLTNMLIILTMPASIALPYLVPRLRRARREYYFHSYMKRHFFDQHFGGGRRIPLRELKRMIEEAESRHFV